MITGFEKQNSRKHGGSSNDNDTKQSAVTLAGANVFEKTGENNCTLQRQRMYTTLFPLVIFFTFFPFHSEMGFFACVVS